MKHHFFTTRLFVAFAILATLAIGFNACSKPDVPLAEQSSLNKKELLAKLQTFTVQYKQNNASVFLQPGKLHKGRFWRWVGAIFGGLLGDAVGGAIGYGIGSLWNPIAGVALGVSNGSTWSYLVGKWILTGEFELERGNSEQIPAWVYETAPYDTLLNMRSFTANPFDTLGQAHNELMDYLFLKTHLGYISTDSELSDIHSQIDSFWNEKQWVPTAGLYNSEMLSLSDMSNLTGANDFSSFENLNDDLSDTTILKEYITESALPEDLKEIVTLWLTTAIQIEDFESMVAFTKEFESVIIEEGRNSLNEEEYNQLLVFFSISRASMCWWYNILVV